LSAQHWKENKEFLAQLASRPRFGLFSDLDGTLSPIAATPEAARITPKNREMLAELNKQLPLVAVISGRQANDLVNLVRLDDLTYLGNHGLERWVDGSGEVIPEAKKYLGALSEVKPLLRVADEPGVIFEDKGVVLTVHYRQVESPAAFYQRHAGELAKIAESQGLMLLTGKMVFEVRPPVAMHKGIALQQLISEYSLEAVLFLGDDISDLMAFVQARELREAGLCDSWSVGVQSEDAPEGLAETADSLADGVDDVEELLAWLLKARKASST
jgi:trehalose 6-phosphate phosphatase